MPLQPSPVKSRWIPTLLAATILSISMANPAPAQTRSASEQDPAELTDILKRPVGVLCIASIDRVLGDIGYMFDSVDRADMMEVIKSRLERVGQLEGLDRTKPLGMMVFLQEGFPPTPEVVGYFPVSNVRDLTKTLELGPVSVRKIPDSEGRYEVRGPNQTFHVKMQDDYAFVSNNYDVVDRQFPDPVEFTKLQTEKWDLSVTANIETVPAGLRNILMTFIKSSAEAEWQRRDDESEAAHRIRKANGESTLIFLEQLVTQCDAISFGIDASSEQQSVLFDLDIRATPESPFSEYLTNIAGRRSFFECLLNDNSPGSLSLSWSMDEREKDASLEMLDAGQDVVAERLGEEDASIGLAASLFAPMKATVGTGHLDLFAQFLPTEDGKLVLIGALRMQQADQFAAAVRNLLSQLSDTPALRNLELDVDSHQGITFHRLQGAESRRQDVAIYGVEPSLFVGIGRQTMWFAVGGEDALEQLKTSVDIVLEELSAPVDRSPAAPFQIVSHILPWMRLNEPDSPSEPRQMASQAFRTGGDTVRLDFQPTDDGGRLRLKLDEGFLRLVGMALSDRYDRSQL